MSWSIKQESETPPSVTIDLYGARDAVTRKMELVTAFEEDVKFKGDWPEGTDFEAIRFGIVAAINAGRPGRTMEGDEEE